MRRPHRFTANPSTHHREPDEFERFDTKWHDENRISSEAESDYSASATEQKVRWYQAILRGVMRNSTVAINGNHNDITTRKALREFQKQHNLQPTGYLTVESNAALTQTALEWIYNKKAVNRVGTWGAGLRAQIVQFQRDYHLGPDGQVGPATREKMLAVLLGQVVLPPSVVIENPPASAVTRLGSRRKPYHRKLGWLTPVPPDSVRTRKEPEEIYFHLMENESFVSDHCPVGLDDGLRPLRRGNHREIPYRWVCQLQLQWRSPYNRRRYARASGTGFLISPQHILTTAHNLLDFIPGWDTPRPLPVTRVIISPGRAGAVSFPYGRIRLGWSGRLKLFIAKGWWNESHRKLNDRFDYGVIKLPLPIDNLKRKGREEVQFGYWEIGKPLLLQEVVGNRAFVSGYTCLGKSLWISNGPTSSYTDHGRLIHELIEYEPQRYKGDSGSPVWISGRNGSKRLVAIHGGGVRNKAFGILLGDSVVKEIKTWLRL